MNHRYKIRLSIFFFIFSAGYAIVLANIFYIQIVQHGFFTQLGQKQYHVSLTSTPDRAAILDRNGKLLAFNKDSLSAFILPRHLEQPEQLRPFLAKYFPAALERLNRNPNAKFLYVQRRLNPVQYERILHSALSDIKFINEPQRYYPLAAASSLIGITNIDNKGLTGLELQFDDQLSGLPTTTILAKDARSQNFYFKKELQTTGLEGTPVQLTLDSNLQFLVFQLLQEYVQQWQAQEGAALVIDAHSGAVLALAHYPMFDANNFNESLETTSNAILTHAYELGSVMKICTALAALEEKVVTCDELIDCKNSKTTFIEGRKINTVKADGVIPFEQVIAQSNNIGIAQVAQRLNTKLYDHYKKLGFGSKTGLEFPGENKGFINPPSQWSKQSVISLSYGYEISANLAQLARAFCIIANDGYDVSLQVLLNKESGPVRQLYSPKAIEDIQAILEKTTQEGTARKARIKGYRVMCKTGTANILENGIYNRDKNIFTCAGIIQKGAYKKVIIVFIKETKEKNLYAATVAAPLFEKIGEATLINDRII